MAALFDDAGIVPYLQFGEVQWWYFPYDHSGLPFYDEYTKSRFQSEYGRQLAIISDGSVSPAEHPEEAAFLPRLIGEFTDAIIAYVRATHPNARFEVLYPVDVNDGAFNRVINYPATSWTPEILDNLKTESFTYTYARDLELCKNSIGFGADLAFPVNKRSHLVGISDPIAPWLKEVDLAQAQGVESVVLFALDQFCLMGYPADIRAALRRSTFQS